MGVFLVGISDVSFTMLQMMSGNIALKLPTLRD
jgi:hypothetical protein